MDPTPPPKKPPQRPSFTLQQLRQAATLGFVTDDDRAERAPMPTYAIDDIPPETLSDRDDGISIEVAPQGTGYRVHVTIADVAAHIPAHTALAKAAVQRGFTVYRPGGNSTLFPQELQDRLSLEDREKRLGLTITIDLDAQYQPVHTEFQRVLTDTYATSYEQARTKMETDPQFQLMAKIAHGVRDHYFGQHYEALKSNNDKSATTPNATPSQIAATKLVELYMLLANNVTASFFNRTQIPFIYRNFDRDGTNAYYSTTAKGHAQLGKQGLAGAYCHFTSPIRRGVDFFDQHQAHFVMDCMAETEKGLQKIDPTLDTKKLHHLLWDNGHHLLILLAQNSSDIVPIEHALQAIITEAGTMMSVQNLAIPLKELARQLSAQKPPYSEAELAENARHINRLMRVEQTESIKILKDKEAIQTSFQHLATLNKETLANAPPQAFSRFLRDAALTGILPKPLFKEALKRMNNANAHHHLLMPAEDGLQIMIIAAYPQDPRWRNLKRAMARLIKHDPIAVNGIIDLAIHAADAFQQGTVKIAQTSLSLSVPEADKEIPHVQAALVAYQPTKNAPLMSAPAYSLGHDKRAALSHAKYSFIEHYAFGELRPLEQIYVPNLLYAELENTEKSRKQLVEKIAHELNAHVDIAHYTSPTGKNIVSLTLSGGTLVAPITMQAEETTLAEAEHAVIRKVLRNPHFKNSSSLMSAADMDRLLNPQKTLERLAKEYGGSFTKETVNISKDKRQPSRFLTRLHFALPATTENEALIVRRAAKGPNKDRAIHDAAFAMLDVLEKEHGVLNKTAITRATQADSWTSRIKSTGKTRQPRSP